MVRPSGALTVTLMHSNGWLASSSTQLILTVSRYSPPSPIDRSLLFVAKSHAARARSLVICSVWRPSAKSEMPAKLTGFAVSALEWIAARSASLIDVRVAPFSQADVVPDAERPMIAATAMYNFVMERLRRVWHECTAAYSVPRHNVGHRGLGPRSGNPL